MGWNLRGKCIEPLVYVREEGEELVISADLPWVRKENIKVFLTEDTAEIAAEIERTLKFRGWGIIRKEIEFNSMRKVVSLPLEVVPEEAKAKFRHGILEIRVPKKIKKKRIEIE